MGVRGFCLALSCLALLLSGCAHTHKNGAYDPLEKVNRGIYAINDAVDRVALTPLAKGYTKLTPKPLRTMVSNFFDNVGYLDTILNDFLQGKGKQGVSDLARFLVNSTIGIGGLFDIAKDMGLEKHQEDFGQTLGVWGSGPGPYLVLPLYGPSTMRDAPGLAVSTVTNGLYWMAKQVNTSVMWPIYILGILDQRARAENAIRFRNELALDPYLFTREAWVQHREYLIYDGHPPIPEFEDEFEDDLDEEGQ